MIKIDKKSQLEAKEYVLNKMLTRPKTTWWSPVLLLFFSASLGVGIGILVVNILQKFFLLEGISAGVIVVAAAIISQRIFLKKLVIVSIECYQHYASEGIRRTCLCKPTCSEYAILVLKKHYLWKALRLMYIRLKITCTGNLYKIDFP